MWNKQLVERGIYGYTGWTNAAIWEYKLMKAELAGKICIKLTFEAQIMVEIGYMEMPVLRHNNQLCRIMTIMYGIHLTQSANTLYYTYMSPIHVHVHVCNYRDHCRQVATPMRIQ